MQGRGSNMGFCRAALLVLMAASTAGAVDFYVDEANGNDERSGLSWSEAKASIGAAIVAADGTAAGASNRILVAAGTYECFTPDSNTTIEGGYPVGGGERDLGVNETTIVSSRHYCIRLHSRDAVALDGLSIVGHRADPDRGWGSEAYASIDVQNSNGIRLSNIQVRDGSAVSRYACIYYNDPNDPTNSMCVPAYSAVATSVGISVSTSEIYLENILLAGNRFEGEQLSAYTDPACDWECYGFGEVPSAMALRIYSSTGWVRNLTATSNIDDSWFGWTPALQVYSSPDLVLENIIAAGNVVSEDLWYRGLVQISHSNVGSMDSNDGEILGNGNISEDPMFVPGPLGDFYLAQGNPWDPGMSPCVDAGSEPAEAAGMDTMTTSADESFDTGNVDIGYHYPVPAEPRKRLIRLVQDAEGTHVMWQPVAGREYDILRGLVSELSPSPNFTDLGMVDCVASQTLTGDAMDTMLPDRAPEGDLFFYVMRDRGGSDDYGVSSNGRQREANFGNPCP